MPELLSPGVFVEEVAAPITTVTAASTSSYGFPGGAKRGPTDVATLIVSSDQFEKTFGGPMRESKSALHAAAFFTNGGRRLYFTRVAPSNAVLAGAAIMNDVVDATLVVVTTAQTEFYAFAATTVMQTSSGVAPIKPSSLTISYRNAGTPVSGQATRDRADSAGLTTATSVAVYEGRINPASLPAADAPLQAIVPGTVVLNISVNSVVQNVAITATTPIATGTLGTAPNTITARVDHVTGRFSIVATGTMVPVVGDNGVAITADFTPTTTTRTITDDGSGNLVGTDIDGTYAIVVTSGDESINPNTVNYLTGGYNFALTAAPSTYSNLYVSYEQVAWDFDPVSVGVWGNDLRLELRGNTDSYTTSTGAYSLYDLVVYLKDEDTGLYVVQEQYSELSLTDETSAMYFPDVLNELSDLVSVTDPGGNIAPAQLNGVSRTFVLAGGDESSAGQTITGTLPGAAIAPRSVSIAFTDNTGAAKVITDDGAGNLIGDVDAAGTNTITYSTGAVNFKTSATIDGGTLVVATYVSAPVTTAQTEDFGDTAELFTVGGVTYFTAGTDGTYTSAYWGRSQFSDSTLLLSTRKGLFAFERVEEILQISIPDFAGDTTVSGDLLDYAALRAALPSGGDRFVILCPPVGKDPQEAVDWLRYSFGRKSSYAAVYWPWIKVADPLANGRPLLIPPVSHVAGRYAYTDVNRNVGKAPAGTVDGQLSFLLGIEYESTQSERDILYPNNINPIVKNAQVGQAIFGARTISAQSQWRNINARRLFMFLEKSIYNDTFWVVFESNGPALWGRLATQINSALNNWFADGYFAGANAAQAYNVVVDSSNNSISSNQVVVDVSAAPNTPGEFVRFRFSQLSL